MIKGPLTWYLRPNAFNLGSFENEALENEDRITKHPKLENEAPYIENEDPKISETKHPKLENEDPKISKTKHKFGRSRFSDHVQNIASHRASHAAAEMHLQLE